MKLAWKLLKTDWRAGELPLLFAGLFLAVVVVTGLTLFSGRLQIMLAGESSQFLAADRVLTSPRPVKTTWLEKAQQLGLQRTQHLMFQSMVYANDQPQLVSVKAADNAYPLRGELKYRLHAEADIISSQQGPKAGELWAEARLFSLLPLQLGDEVYIGDAPLKVTAILVSEPDRGAGSLSMGPRVLMHWSDIEKTAVVAEGSRLSYSYLFAGDAEAISAYQKWLLTKISDSEKWLDLENTQPTIAVALSRAQNFFLLASSIIVILASVAIAMTSSRYSQRHIEQVAVLKTLGANSGDIARLYWQMLLLLLAVTLITAWSFAYVLQEVVVRLVATNLKVSIPAISVWPFVLGFSVAALSLLTFSLPPLMQLKNIPAIHIFQSQYAVMPSLSKRSLLFAVIGLMVILILYTQQWLLGSLLLLSVVVLCVLVALPAAWLLNRAGSVSIKASGWQTLALSNIQRRLKINAIQTAIFAMSLMLLLLIFGIKNTLFVQWQSQLPPKTPNYFLVNIQDEQWQDVNQWLEERSVLAENLYPMVRARLIEINQQPVREFVSKEELSRAGADRELNLSWAKTLPPDNTLVEGEWWNKNNSSNGVSVEQKIAERLKIKVGDTLTFMSAADTFQAKVSSIRKVEWDRMRPNFYMLFTQQQLNDYPKTYMTSFWLPDNQQKQVTQLLQQFPTTVVIDIDVLIKQIRMIIDHVSLALEVIMVFVVIASLLVMIATVQNSLAERMQENTVIRALGGTRKLIAGSLFAEFALIGFISGILATFGAEAVMLLLQYKVFEMPMQLHPELWFIAPVLGVVVIGFAGFISARKVLQVAPMQLLREM
jgi:putative ABC transport system permease protein